MIASVQTTSPFQLNGAGAAIAAEADRVAREGPRAAYLRLYADSVMEQIAERIQKGYPRLACDFSFSGSLRVLTVRGEGACQVFVRLFWGAVDEMGCRILIGDTTPANSGDISIKKMLTGFEITPQQAADLFGKGLSPPASRLRLTIDPLSKYILGQLPAPR